MNGTNRLRIGDINKNLICTLCGGYFIDATTIIECLHSFCRTCIVTYLKTSKTCPVCDTIVHKTRPHQNIRSDKLLQDLVYKLVPGLYKDEMRRRREFYTCHYEAAPKRPGEERGDEMSDRFAYTEEEKISLALYFCQDGVNERMDFRRVFTSKEDLKARMEKKIQNAVDVRYLQCKAAVTVGLLKKFIRLKYGLPSHFQVDMFYNDEPLKGSCTLCDVAYMFNWRRRAPLMLTFCVYESAKKVENVRDVVKPALPLSFKEEIETPTPPASLSTTSTVTVTVTEMKPSSVATLSTTPTTASVLSVTVPTVTANSSSLPKNDPTKHPSLTKQIKPKPPKPPSTPKISKSKAPTSALSSKPGNNESPAKSRKTLLGKRPANTPVPIAPAPAKIPAMNSSSLVDLARFIKLDPSQQVPTAMETAGSPKLVSLLPAGMAPPSSTPKASPTVRVSNPQASTITFSVSSILNAVTSKQGNVGMVAPQKPTMLGIGMSGVPTSLTVPSTTSHKPALTLLGTPTLYPAASPKPYSLPASKHAQCAPRPVLMAPKVLTAPKATVRPQSQASGHYQPASSPASKPPPLPLSQYSLHYPTNNKLSSSSSSSSSSSLASMNSAQNVTTTSIASPTPAASASPTPAAVPMQQSQTQGSDSQQPHTNSLPTGKDKCADVPPANTPRGLHPHQGSQTSNINIMRNDRTAEFPTAPNSARQETKFVCQQRQSPIEGNRTVCEKSCVAASTPHSSSTTTTAFTSPASLNSSASSVQSSPELSGSSQSPALSPTAGSCPQRKPVKQKKIADIANTLHKRMSETLLNQVGKRSSSPSGRRPGQASSPGVRNLHTQPALADRHEGPGAMLNRHDQSTKESLQNVPPNGLILDKAGVTEALPPGQVDEPLNLVKKDKEMVHLTNGMFILDIPSAVK